MQADRGDDAPVRRELVPPGGHEVPCLGGNDDPVVRGPAGVAEGAVAAGNAHVRVARAAEVRGGLGGQIVVELDGHDGACRAGELGEEGGVEPGGGADLQDSLPGLHGELLEHGGYELGAGCRGQGRAIRGAAGNDGVAAVGVAKAGAGQEQVPGHGAERGLD